MTNTSPNTSTSIHTSTLLPLSSTHPKQYTITALPTNPTSKDLESVISLFKSYASTLNIDLSFQDFATELSSLPGKYSPSQDGAILLARDTSTGEAVGCIALRKLGIASPSPSTAPQDEIDTKEEPQKKVKKTAELKRLFILPSARGTGLGKKLAQTMIQIARKLDYDEIKLDTLPSMKAAIGMYESLGFVDIEPYCFNPVEGVRFLGLGLRLGMRK